MENASKALLMAGGILISIIILAVLVRTFGTIVAFQKTQLSEEEQAQLAQFNSEYTKYLNQYVYGTEVRTVINKSENNGMVTVIILPEGTEPPTGVGQDTQYYKCTEITYNDSTGRVNSITFVKVTINQSEE